MKKRNFILTLASAVITFCFISGYVYAEKNAFELKCAKCHSLKKPDNYTKAEWKYNVERMAQRAGLTPEEIKAIIELNKKK